MVSFHFHAQFLPDAKKFKVQVKTHEKLWVELMSIARFLRWARATDEPLVISGYTFKFNDYGAEALKELRAYFKKVADSYVNFKYRKVNSKQMESGAGKAALPMPAKQIKADGTISLVVPRNGMQFTYEELLELAEAEFVQVIKPPSSLGAVMVIDEEGKMNKKPVNGLATRMWQQNCDPGSLRAEDAVVGTVLLCQQSQLCL